jgi:pimeloyl-ACP methyl ester carboxylesterase
MSTRRKGKLAIFVHGWDATGAVWNQPKSNPNAIKRLFEAKGYLVDQLDLPGKFMAHRKDFYYYAEFLAKKIDAYALPNSLSPQDDGWADEITLVCHSMGGAVALLYLREDIGDPEAKKKITRVIALASPFHGTSVPVKQIAHVFMPGIGDITFDAFMRRVVACYQQVQLASPFMRKLHSLPDRTPHIKFHCIWTRGDVVIAPNHTAIMEGAGNYYIDSARVGHPDIMWNAETLRIIKDILDGKAKPSGLQTYPPTDTGANHLHQWFPSSGTDEHTRGWSAGEKRYFAWRCLNEGCHAAEISVNRPSLKGCSIGQSVEKRRWHKWQRTGIKRYICNRCGLTLRETSRPLPTDAPECIKNGKIGKHVWTLQSQQWVCANESPCRKCGEKVWRLFRPSVRGCSDRVKKNDYHLWEKREPRFQYMFKCAVCHKTVWHSDKPSKGRAQS